MTSLLQSTGKFDRILNHIDLDADSMRETVRESLPAGDEFEEVFFYFSGHGLQSGADLYLSGTTFVESRPNETGVSYSELMDLFRSASPNVLITVIDACFSGALLVKSSQLLGPVSKDGLRSVLQFSSSLDDQTSLGGDSLSAFTRAFLEACLRKTSGVVYYTDIKNTLRDEFIGNDEQTPFFVNQGTGREVLVDDAKKLTVFRASFFATWPADRNDDEETGEADSNQVVLARPLTSKELLEAAEQNMGDPDKVQNFVDRLFDGVVSKFKQSEFSEFFQTSVVEHKDYQESVTREFLIRVLSRENRPDKLVTAEITRKRKEANSWDQAIIGLMSSLNQGWTEHFTLHLNCEMSRAQLKLTLTPRYIALHQLQLVLSCAPSLDQCYVFEMVTQHPRTDWDSFDRDGREIVRRWYTLGWADDVEFLTGKICEALTKSVRDHINDTSKRLDEGE